MTIQQAPFRLVAIRGTPSRVLGFAVHLLIILGICHAAVLRLAAQSKPGLVATPLKIPTPLQGTTRLTALSSSVTHVNFTNQLSREAAAENQIRLNGSGVAAGDVDGDGWCDLFFCSIEGQNRLFRNRGDWIFDDITARSGGALNEPGANSTGCALADIDGDGDLDLLVTSIQRGVRIFRNDGRGTFSAWSPLPAMARALGSMSLAVADLDGDGDLDIYVTNYRPQTIRSTGFAVLNINGRRLIRPEDRGHLEYNTEGRILEAGEPDQLFLNEGQGQFSLASWTDGRFLDEDGKPLQEPPRDWGLTVLARDFNGDGEPDLYICNDFHTPDRLWINQGRGKFRPIPPRAFRSSPTFSMCADVADLNRDGFMDFLVVDMLASGHVARMTQSNGKEPVESTWGPGTNRIQQDRNTLQLGRGDGTFADVTFQYGIESTGWTWSSEFLDVDLDGYEDLLVTTGNMFNTQDLDANAAIDRGGPYSREMIPKKLLMYPSHPEPLAAYRNVKGERFESVGREWGFDHVGIGHGMCLADLDNDGDLDVIINHLNGEAGLYRNDSPEPRVAFQLHGLSPNTRAIGSRLILRHPSLPTQSQEIIAGGRYLSSDQPLRTFAASTASPMTLEVLWRSGRRSLFTNIVANHLYDLHEPDSPPSPPPVPAPSPTWFTNVSSLFPLSHSEPPYDDFIQQPLLPHRLSQPGPTLAWVDLDHDGWDDLWVSASRGSSPTLFHNRHDLSFHSLSLGIQGQPEIRDQYGLAVDSSPSGQPLLLAASANYEDGDSSGFAVRSFSFTAGPQQISNLIPCPPWSVGPLVLADFDGDGNLELLAAGRVTHDRYPEPVSSLIYRRRNNTWEPDPLLSQPLQNLGLVSAALASDLDGDSIPELILACEWGPLRIFSFLTNSLSPTPRELTSSWRMDSFLGWWNSVTSGDFDGDGRMDLVAGNWGRNSKYRASPDQPRRMYFGELSGAHGLDVLEVYYAPELRKWVPERDLNTLAKVLPFLREHYPTHLAFASAGIDEILGERLASLRRLDLTFLDSALFLNRGDHFEVRSLPAQAQWSPVFGLNAADINGDGHEDLLLAQNFFAVQGQTSRSDAGRALLLQGDGQGGFIAVPGQTSGLQVYGEQRGSALGDFDRDGRWDWAVGQNNGPLQVFRNQLTQYAPGVSIKLQGDAANPLAIGAVLRLRQGTWAGPARQIHSGSGYASQDSLVQILSRPSPLLSTHNPQPSPPLTLEVRWPHSSSPHSYTLPTNSLHFLIQLSHHSVSNISLHH